MNLFDLSLKRDIVDKNVVLNKIERAKNLNIQPVQKKAGPNLMTLVQRITDDVNAYLGDKKNNYELITTESRLKEYVDHIISNGIFSIDTETTGLDVMSDSIVGFSLYTPGEKAAYIPLNHVSYITNELLSDQLPMNVATEQLSRLETISAVFANAKFDIKILKNTLNVVIHPYFDCILAARMLNENEQSNRLKDLYKKYILKGKEDTFTFSALFKGVKFNLIPPNVGYLYAARDAEMTWELFEFQLPYLTPENELCLKQDLVDVSKVFWDIEMPTIEVLAEIEQSGVTVDKEISKHLVDKYIPKLKSYEEAFNNKLLEFGITRHFDISSSKQLGELFYDVLGLVSPDPEKPRGTSKDVLKLLDHPIVDAVKDYRSVATIVNTFVKKLPTEVNSRTGKIHCNYVQVGSDDDDDSGGRAPVTGRLACNHPNMQQIPARGEAKEIRNMFCASTEFNTIDSNDDNSFSVKTYCELKTPTGWKKVKDLKESDNIIIKNNNKELIVRVTSISNRDKNTVCINWI